jgi:hypothetical protein
MAGQRQHQGAVQQVTATVRLWSGVQRLRGSSADVNQRAHHVPRGTHADPDNLHVRVRLAALLKDGATVDSADDDFGISTPRQGAGAIWHRYRGPRLSDDPATEAEMLNHSYRVAQADIEDAINQMLGRDPELHRPPGCRGVS